MTPDEITLKLCRNRELALRIVETVISLHLTPADAVDIFCECLGIALGCCTAAGGTTVTADLIPLVNAVVLERSARVSAALSVAGTETQRKQVH